MYSIFELVKVFKLRIFKNVILKILKLIYNLKKIYLSVQRFTLKEKSDTNKVFIKNVSYVKCKLC